MQNSKSDYNWVAPARENVLSKNDAHLVLKPLK